MEILYVLSVKYYVYIFIHLCVNLQMPAICYLYYDVQWYCFWGCGLSTECVVAHPLHLSLFSPRCLWLYVHMFMAVCPQLCVYIFKAMVLNIACLHISVNGNM